ncbi:hypothetical protein [Plesiomonas sp. ZOR0011]|uniref:hypothetical protein n=1 Tax=Plesiomonas sp. ZOR0011 TaxID=1339230 RepID=UPI000645A8BA|nr:hypothetical protein [Plesiomonas sp. ZOR0011]
MSNITESAGLIDIAKYLKRMHGYSDAEALVEAKEVLAGFQDMSSHGIIKGWYFDAEGHLELLPNERIK